MYTGALEYKKATEFGVVKNFGTTDTSLVYGVNGFVAGVGSSAFGNNAYAGGNPNGPIILPPPSTFDPNDPGYDADYVAFYNLSNNGALDRSTLIPAPEPQPPALDDPDYAAKNAKYTADLAIWNSSGGKLPAGEVYPATKFPFTAFTNTGDTALGDTAQAGATAAGQNNATAVGQAAAANALNATAVGQGSSAIATGATAVGQGASASAANAVAIGVGSSASASNAVALGANSVANQANTVSVGSVGAERRIVNVAAGVMGTDAVNVNQLNAAIAGVSDASTNGGNSAGLDKASATGDGAYAGGYGSQASGDQSTAIGNGATASAQGAVAVGAGAQATGDPTTAVGNMAVASGANASAFGANALASGTNALALGQGSTASGANSTAVGRGASAIAANSVALGAGSTAARGALSGYAAYGLSDPQSSSGEVSVGSTGGARQVTNVAAGSAATDAVNVEQLQGATAGAVSSANAYTDTRFNVLNGSLDRDRQRADAGSAAAMAIAGLTQAVTPGKSMITGGVGVWRDQTAVAFGVSHRFNTDWTVKAGGSFAINGGAGFNASVGREF